MDLVVFALMYYLYALMSIFFRSGDMVLNPDKLNEINALYEDVASYRNLTEGSVTQGNLADYFSALETLKSQHTPLTPAKKETISVLQFRLDVFFQNENTLFEKIRTLTGGYSGNEPVLMKVWGTNQYFVYKRNTDNLANRERLAYALDGALGFNHMLYFVEVKSGLNLRNGNTITRTEGGFIVPFYTDERSQDKHFRFDRRAAVHNSLILLDYILNNFDRHKGNFMLSEDPLDPQSTNCWAIDHDACLRTARIENCPWISIVCKEANLSETQRKRLKINFELINRDDLRSLLKELPDTQKDQVMRRVQDVGSLLNHAKPNLFELARFNAPYQLCTYSWDRRSKKETRIVDGPATLDSVGRIGYLEDGDAVTVHCNGIQQVLLDATDLEIGYSIPDSGREGFWFCVKLWNLRENSHAVIAVMHDPEATGAHGQVAYTRSKLNRTELLKMVDENVDSEHNRDFAFGVESHLKNGRTTMPDIHSISVLRANKPDTSE